MTKTVCILEILISDLIEGSVNFSKFNLVNVLSAKTKNFIKPQLTGFVSIIGLNSVCSRLLRKLILLKTNDPSNTTFI